MTTSSSAVKISRVIEGAIPDAPLPEGTSAGRQRKIDSIQLLRGVAALSVVLYHLWLLERKYSAGNTLLPDVLNAGRSGVDLFFVISGFIMVLITRKKWGGKKNSLNFLLHRWARIYPNYWFYFFLTFAVVLVQPSFVNASQGGKFNFLSSFFLYPSTSLPLVMVAWSLIYELYFYLLFSLLMRCREAVVIRLLFVWMIFLTCINLAPGLRAGPMLQVALSPYSIEFIFGALGALIIGHPFVRRLPDGILFTLVAASILAVPFLFPRLYGSGSFIGPRLLVQTLVFGGIFVVLVISLATIELKKELRFWKGLVILGDISFTVYLSQLLIMGAVGRVWSAYFMRPGSWIDNVVFMLISILAIVFYSQLAYKIIEKPSYEYIIERFVRKSKVKASR
jgi:peptidoglycan/LPS O-acetylase OafA/YrhL